ncbi:Oidioi.mRNA.OKI2018_I69.chr2.g6276.t1.cds [Oikopleura dioica]|uniref:Oidioi.mRNA.OKI2018_I69.chr2.g6276.t1.cds n=1 Tax=Oikopleura dioica TaxID=34765 RepID=A0ABN7T8Z3_OIKDI|nr:Oidioi.mRNA.OKI2018_I69.chr2.g6276.t1.cds [Oikopleura dioica]
MSKIPVFKAQDTSDVESWKCDQSCPIKKKDCREFCFVDDQFGLISRKFCRAWLKNENKKKRKRKNEKKRQHEEEISYSAEYSSVDLEDMESSLSSDINSASGFNPEMSVSYSSVSSASLSSKPFSSVSTISSSAKSSESSSETLSETFSKTFKVPISVPIDFISLSFGDFIIHKLIYKQLSWDKALERCQKIGGKLPYFNTKDDLRSFKDKLFGENKIYGTNTEENDRHHIWLGYRRYARNKNQMMNVYTNEPSTIAPYQTQSGQRCAAYNPTFISMSYFDFYCGSFERRATKDIYLTLCFVPDPHSRLN